MRFTDIPPRYFGEPSDPEEYEVFIEYDEWLKSSQITLCFHDLQDIKFTTLSMDGKSFRFKNYNPKVIKVALESDKLDIDGLISKLKIFGIKETELFLKAVSHEDNYKWLIDTGNKFNNFEFCIIEDGNEINK